MSKETRSRGWCLTWNNWTPEDRLTLERVACQYIVFGEEKAPTTGTPHLQGFVYFANARTLSSMKKIHTSISWRAAKGNAEQNFEYCSKDGVNVFERGERPKTSAEKGDDERQRWRDIIKLAEDGNMDALREDHPDVYFNKLGCIKAVHAARKRTVADLDGDLEHQWFYGPSGCGKSRRARDENPDAFIKLVGGRWWDGYDDEDVVIIDDWDPYLASQGGDLKRWSDRYVFPAEIKGTVVKIRPRKIVVTSQYLPRQCWTDKATVAAIERRFNVIDFTSDAAAEAYYGLAVGPTPPGPKVPPPAGIVEDVAEGDVSVAGLSDDETFGDVM